MNGMSTVMDSVKAHPMITLGGAVGVIIAMRILTKPAPVQDMGGGGVFTLTTDPNLIMAEQQTTQAQLAAGVASQQIAASLELGKFQSSAELEYGLAQGVNERVMNNANVAYGIIKSAADANVAMTTAQLNAQTTALKNWEDAKIAGRKKPKKGLFGHSTPAVNLGPAPTLAIAAPQALPDLTATLNALNNIGVA